mmetsp:Transcript_34659/g.80054  ORF Transcript_34659/g.80054 Transcript_34659/m.80054 type:complete len:448 (+) Transcript_34659:172-1515(+)
MALLMALAPGEPRSALLACLRSCSLAALSPLSPVRAIGLSPVWAAVGACGFCGCACTSRLASGARAGASCVIALPPATTTVAGACWRTGETDCGGGARWPLGRKRRLDEGEVRRTAHATSCTAACARAGARSALATREVPLFPVSAAVGSVPLFPVFAAASSSSVRSAKLVDSTSSAKCGGEPAAKLPASGRRAAVGGLARSMLASVGACNVASAPVSVSASSTGQGSGELAALKAGAQAAFPTPDVRAARRFRQVYLSSKSRARAERDEESESLTSAVLSASASANASSAAVAQPACCSAKRSSVSVLLARSSAQSAAVASGPMAMRFDSSVSEVSARLAHSALKRVVASESHSFVLASSARTTVLLVAKAASSARRASGLALMKEASLLSVSTSPPGSSAQMRAACSGCEATRQRASAFQSTVTCRSESERTSGSSKKKKKVEDY